MGDKSTNQDLWNSVGAAAAQAHSNNHISASALNSFALNHTHHHGLLASPPPGLYPSQPNPFHLLLQRLAFAKGNSGDTHGFQFLHAYVDRAGSKVIVFAVKNGEPITILDDFSLFPSDQLVTQLRLLDV